MKSKATPFGRLIRKYRIDKGVVLKDASDAIGVSTAHMSAIELGKKSISDAFIEKVISYFELSIAQANELKKAAALSQPTVKLNMQNQEDQDRELVFAFARKYQTLSSEQKEKLKKMLEG